MGNIKHNDELLRINDDGFDVVFNCDNKHQNGVSYHAEKNGKKTKIDPEYAMAALVKKISDGGGSGGWPEDMPVPSVGGYGYTEQESHVAFEGSIDISDGHEFDVESSEPVLEVGKTYTVVIDDAEYANLTAAADEWGGVMVGDRSYAVYPFSIAAYPYEIYINLDPSIYARGPIYNIKIESTEETIHMIDSKYLPASGGMMVVNITGTEEDGYHADKTAKEIYEAMPNVICKIVDGNRFEFCNSRSCIKSSAEDEHERYFTTFNNIAAGDSDEYGNITLLEATFVTIESVDGDETVEVSYSEKEF